MAVYALKFISGKYQGGEFPVPDDGELIIGRASDLDLVLVEDMVSRKHAKVVAQAGSLTITDLGSTNGTFVNGEKVRRTQLKKNDRILIGTSIVKVIPAGEMKARDTDARAAREMLETLADRAPESSTMSGELEEVPLPDLLQLFATNKKSGILTITGTRRGKVYIKAGQIIYALIGGEQAMRPVKAIGRMVAWADGAFHVEEWDGTHEFAEIFESSTESVLMEALRQHDELRRLLEEMPSPESAVALCLPMAPKLRELGPSELDTLQLALNFNTLKAVIDKTEDTDHQAVVNLRKLLTEGYLEVELE